MSLPYFLLVLLPVSSFLAARAGAFVLESYWQARPGWKNALVSSLLAQLAAWLLLTGIQLAFAHLLKATPDMFLELFLCAGLMTLVFRGVLRLPGRIRPDWKQAFAVAMVNLSLGLFVLLAGFAALLLLAGLR